MSEPQIRIVLVETSHPGNIGASARAMKTMGLSDLTLVRPKLFPNAEATAMASGADDVLMQAKVVDDLDAALEGCRFVVGTTARARHLSGASLLPREAARRLVEGTANGPVALVFGRERIGLTNDEVDRCQALTRIPANPAYSSLNLAQAVQVLTYELNLALGATLTADADHVPAPYEERERFYVHLENVLVASGFLDPGNPKHLMRRLRRLFNRADPDQHEMNILRGVLTAVAPTVAPGTGKSDPS